MGNLIVIFTSVLSSGVIAAIISFSFVEAKERWQFQRAKIEEIYLSASEWLASATAYFLPAVGVCKGELTYNQMLDLQINHGEKRSDSGLNLRRVKMNIYMYEPSLIPDFEKVDSNRSQTVRIISAIRRCWEETGQASEFLGPLKKQLDAFDAASMTLQTAIIERGVSIGSETGQAAKAYNLAKSKARRRAAGVGNAVKRQWSRLRYRAGASQN